MIKTFDHVLAHSQPVFELTVYKTRLGAIQSVSRLQLPLSTQDHQPGMIMLSRITRFQRGHSTHADDQRKAAMGRLIDSYNLRSVEELQLRLSDWELRANALGRHAVGRQDRGPDLAGRSDNPQRVEQ